MLQLIYVVFATKTTLKIAFLVLCLMKFNYVNKTEDRTATMLIYDQIGGYGINGALFASELNWVANSGQFDKIYVRINSVGGSVIEGMSIFSAIVNSPIPVETFIDYLAASMGGVIAMAGKKVHMAENALIMLHNPFNPDGEDSAKEKDVLNKIKDTLVNVYTNKTGKDESFISGLMDKETWLSAKEAKDYGMVDTIYSSMVKPKTRNMYDNSFVLKISAQLKTQMDTPIEMEALKNELDKLKASVSQIEEENKNLKSENEALKKQVSEKDGELQKVKEKEAVELVENAIKDGKVKKESRENLIESATKDYSLVKNMLDGIQTAQVARFSNVAGSGKKENDRENWSYSDWEKKDPKGLTDMYKNDIEKYKELLTAHKSQK